MSKTPRPSNARPDPALAAARTETAMDGAVRKPVQGYSSPSLVTYGALHVITARVGSKGKFDGGGGRKTGF